MTDDKKEEIKEKAEMWILIIVLFGLLFGSLFFMPTIK